MDFVALDCVSVSAMSETTRQRITNACEVDGPPSVYWWFVIVVVSAMVQLARYFSISDRKDCA